LPDGKGELPVVLEHGGPVVGLALRFVKDHEGVRCRIKLGKMGMGAVRRARLRCPWSSIPADRSRGWLLLREGAFRSAGLTVDDVPREADRGSLLRLFITKSAVTLAPPAPAPASEFHAPSMVMRDPDSHRWVHIIWRLKSDWRRAADTAAQGERVKVYFAT
jgi:hypothetical protein